MILTRNNEAIEVVLETREPVVLPSVAPTIHNVASPDGLLLASSVFAGSSISMQTRPRAGGAAVASWQEAAKRLDWSRVPKNCYETTPQGGGGLFGDANGYIEQCAVVVMPDGGSMTDGIVMQAVVIGMDHRVYHAAAKNNSSGVPVWGALNPLVGVGGDTNGLAVKKVAIAGAKDGSIQVVVIAADDDCLYHTVRYANGDWQQQGFAILNGPGGAPGFGARDVAIAISGSSTSSPGSAQVIGSGLADGSLYHRIRNSDGTWTGFQQVPGSLGLNTSSLAIATGSDGNAYVLAMVTGANGQSRIMNQIRYSSGAWNGGFMPVGVQQTASLSYSSDIALTITAAGKAQVLYTDRTGSAWFQERSNPAAIPWTTQVANTRIATKGSTAVSISAPPSLTGTSDIMLVRNSPQ